MAYSRLLNKHYDPSNGSVLYLSNMQQVYKYLNAGAEQDLVDILYTDTKKDCLVFVFKKTPFMSELYERWQNHEL
jgi:hypothetical protein